MGTSFKKRKILTVPYQKLVMEAKYPNLKCVHWNRNSICWEGVLQPSVISKEYKVRIDYSLSHGSGDRPQVFVLSPELEPRPGSKKLPHVFKGKELCLFRYKYREWNDEMFIADSIVPWVSGWLFFYEMWHITGEWHGEGEHPDLKEEE